MAKQRYINTKIWEDSWFSSLDQIEQLVFIYFLTNPMTSICGAYELSKSTISRAVGLDRIMLDEILRRFQESGKVFYVDGWVVLPNFIKHQNNKSPKIRKGIEIELQNVPDEVKKHIKGYGIHTISHSNTNTNSNSNLNSNSNAKHMPESEKVDFETIWKLYPVKSAKKKAKEKWGKLSLEVQNQILADIPLRLAQHDQWKRDRGKYIPHFATYLTGERWNDEIVSDKSANEVYRNKGPDTMIARLEAKTIR